MRITPIAVVAWTVLLVGMCSHALQETAPRHYDTPGGMAGLVLYTILMFAVWVAGLGAIALIRYLVASDEKPEPREPRPGERRE